MFVVLFFKQKCKYVHMYVLQFSLRNRFFANSKTVLIDLTIQLQLCFEFNYEHEALHQLMN